MKILFTVVLLTAFTLAGCISYTDPSVKKLNEEQYATLNLDISLKIVELDGKKVPLNWLAPIDKMKLAPGKHTFKVIWDNVDIKTTPTTVDFELEAGTTYNLLRITDPVNQTWSFKLEKQSNQLNK